MPLDLGTASNFVKGRIGEEIINQYFSAHGYDVSPIGIEHGNFMPIYRCRGRYKSVLFQQTRRTPDFSLTIDNTFRFVESKFRRRPWKPNPLWMDRNVVKTILKTYYFIPYKQKKYVRMHSQFDETIMIWMFSDVVMGFKLGDVTRQIDGLGKSLKPISYQADKLASLALRHVKIPWNQAITDSIHKDDSIRSDIWSQFTKDYPTLLAYVDA